MLTKLRKSKDIDREERRLLLPAQPYAGTLPRFYGLPKVHKIGPVLLRPIITNCGLYSDQAMLKQKSILNLLLWGKTTVANSYEFVNLLQDYCFGSDDRMLSFDVRSLFTRVPVQETLEIVERRLEELRLLPDNPLAAITSMTNRAIMALLNLLLSECYFVWQDGLYKQVSGLPMGGRLSPILANLFMEDLEHRVLCSATILPKIYFRYVDDIFIVWDCTVGLVQEFLALLNVQHKDIELTIEEEVDGELAFLDVSLKHPQFSPHQGLSTVAHLHFSKADTL